MGYTTEFDGQIKVEPKLNQKEIDFLIKFSNTRRMECVEGPYYVERSGFMGQDNGSVVDCNKPPNSQPGLWCQWVPTLDGEHIEWNGSEKFYNSAEWMQYFIDHFIGLDPIAKKELDFLTGHTLTGLIKAQGEEYDDRWSLVVASNVASKKDDPRLGDKVECPHCEGSFTLEN